MGEGTPSLGMPAQLEKSVNWPEPRGESTESVQPVAVHHQRVLQRRG